MAQIFTFTLDCFKTTDTRSLLLGYPGQTMWATGAFGHDDLTISANSPKSESNPTVWAAPDGNVVY